MNRWDEMRTAYAVAKLGTISAAAQHLDIHRATVVRHIDTLETALGGKLFQRHGRGYTPTAAGLDMLRVAQTTEAQFAQLAGRTRGRAMDVSGELVITSVEVIAPLVLPALQAFRLAHPDTQVRYAASGRMYRLEYGEAHVAIRSGQRPQEPDNVVQPFLVMRSGLYAHKRYIERHGLPSGPDDYPNHGFIQDLRHPMKGWGEALFSDTNVVFSSKSEHMTFGALKTGMGLAFYPVLLANQDPHLVQIHAPNTAWDTQFWLVTHIDLHWTAKVQAILKHLRAVADALERPMEHQDKGQENIKDNQRSEDL